MQTTNWSRGLGIEVRGDDVVSHTGSVLTRMLADRTGPTGALSTALARPEAALDRGGVFRDLAVAIADGATHISDITVLGDQRRIFGPLASTTTTWRMLGEIDAKALAAIAVARNTVRRRVWELITARHGGIPAVKTCYGDLGSVIGIRIDATLVGSYSGKQVSAAAMASFTPSRSSASATGPCATRFSASTSVTERSSETGTFVTTTPCRPYRFSRHRRAYWRSCLGRAAYSLSHCRRSSSAPVPRQHSRRPYDAGGVDRIPTTAAAGLTARDPLRSRSESTVLRGRPVRNRRGRTHDRFPARVRR
jgi:hypothetical protein